MQLQDSWSLIQYLIIWASFALLTEAIVEILINAGPLEGFRGWVARRGKILYIDFAELITCGYCCSVWVAFAFAWILPSFIFSDAKFWDSYPVLKIVVLFSDKYLYWFFNWIVLHRLSNIVHIKLKPVKIEV